MDCISTFDITKYPLFDLMRDIKVGRIQLPDFQRDWVWDDNHVRRLAGKYIPGLPRRCSDDVATRY